MSYGADQFVNLIQSWMRDARFHQLVRYGQERHWISATGLRWGRVEQFYFLPRLAQQPAISAELFPCPHKSHDRSKLH